MRIWTWIPSNQTHQHSSVILELRTGRQEDSWDLMTTASLALSRIPRFSERPPPQKIRERSNLERHLMARFWSRHMCAGTLTHMCPGSSEHHTNIHTPHAYTPHRLTNAMNQATSTHIGIHVHVYIHTFNRVVLMWFHRGKMSSWDLGGSFTISGHLLVQWIL